MTACATPFTKNGQAYGCGRCLVCRTAQRRIWQSRLMLEAKDHVSSVFATLTYDDEKIPHGGTLDPGHSRDFLKRLRAKMEPERFRYFLVGEYGSQTQRPHYHAILYNYPHCSYGYSRYSKTRKRCCASCDTILDTWGHGIIFLGDVTNNSAAYVAGYTTKKLSSENTKEKLGGRYPEFTRMSRNPGIGAGLMHELADGLLRYTDNQGRYAGDDVPSELRVGNKTYPLGRFLRRKLRTYVGREANAPPSRLKKMADQMYLVRKVAFDNSWSFKNTLVQVTEGKRANMVSRFKLYGQKRDQL